MKKIQIFALMLIVSFAMIVTGCKNNNDKKYVEIEILNSNPDKYMVCMSTSQSASDVGTLEQLSSGKYEFNGEFKHPWGSLVVGKCQSVIVSLNGVDISDRLILAKDATDFDLNFTKTGYTSYNFTQNSKCIENLFDEIKEANTYAKLVITIK